MELVTVILAAGKGTRMKSELPKVLHPILGIPMINYVIDTAKKIGSDQIVVVVGHQYQKVIDTLNNYYKESNFNYCIQEPQLGTADAVLKCKDTITKNIKKIQSTKYVLILSGDVPLISSTTLLNMIEYHINNKCDATMMIAIEENPKGYGRIIRDKNGDVKKIVEEKDIGNDDNIRQIKEVNCGVYLFKCDELFENLPLVDNNNEQKEYYLPKVLEIFIQRNLKVAAYQNNDMGDTHGVNTIEQLQQIEKYLLKSC